MRTMAIIALSAAALLAGSAAAEDNHLSAGGRAAGPDDTYVGVDIPHHDHDGALGPARRAATTTGTERAESFERCQTILVRRQDGTVQRMKRCRD
jgi:hypothetical protein